LQLPSSGAYDVASLAWVLARAGKDHEARALLDALHARAERGYVSAVAFATVYLGLGERERALDWIERAYAERRGWLVYLRIHPLLDAVREEPRCQALVGKMKL
jgi:serine/threonine-protein kinase